MVALVVLYLTCTVLTIGGGLMSLDGIRSEDHFAENARATLRYFAYGTADHGFHVYNEYIEDYFDKPREREGKSLT
jgi:hypothetical protein